MKGLMSALGILPAGLWGATEAGHFSGISLVASGSSKFTGLVPAPPPPKKIELKLGDST